MNPPANQEKPQPSRTVEPVTWHHGWKKIASTSADTPTRPSAGPTTRGENPAGTSQAPAGSPGEGQGQFRVEHRVTLSTEPAVLMADGTRQQQYLTSSLEQQADDAVPRVIIGHNVSVGVAATFNEARRFALDLLALVDQREARS